MCERIHKVLLLFILVSIISASAGICSIQDSVVYNFTEKDQDAEIMTDLQKRMQQVISVEFRETPIEDVLRALAKQADIDVVKSPEVTGTVTATLTDVPLSEALENILSVHGYGFVATKNMVRVLPKEQIIAVREKILNRVYRITYADVSEVEEALEKFISSEGSISSNPGTSNIIVTDYESKIGAIDLFIEEIDRITPQVLVEVRIYDVTSKDRFDFGINWSVGTNSVLGATLGTGSGGTIGGQTGKVTPFIRSNRDSATNKASSSSNAIRYGILTPDINFDIELIAEEEDLTATLLANPRILVLDNQEAIFKSVSEIPYQELSETSQGGTIGTTEFREVGVELKVIPHVARDDMIRLHVMPEFSVATGAVSVGGFSLPSGNQQPVVDKRNADTKLLIENGQTMVLAGLRRKEVQTQNNKIPLLGDLPLVGGLFGFQGEEAVNSEIIVFITPHVIIDPQLSAFEKYRYEQTKIVPPKMKDPQTDGSQKDIDAYEIETKTLPKKEYK